MKIAFFSAKPYDRTFFDAENEDLGHAVTFLEPRLTVETAVLAAGHEAVCAFVNDDLKAGVLAALKAGGVRHIALRSAGFNHVDLDVAADLGFEVTHVPAYSPHAVAEHTTALILTLNRKTHRAYSRVRDGNFSLDGLLGFDMHGRTIGVIGAGKIGTIFAGIMRGFGCEVLIYDPYPNAQAERLGARYVQLPELLAKADVVSLHCPLTPSTQHLVNAETLGQMQPGVMLINTGRGALIDTPAVIEGLKSGHVGYLGLDVYEEEAALFFEDRSAQVMTDDTFARLLTFPNVVITGHQGFFTREAMSNIARTTLTNITSWERGAGEIFRVPRG